MLKPQVGNTVQFLKDSKLSQPYAAIVTEININGSLKLLVINGKSFSFYDSVPHWSPSKNHNSWRHVPQEQL